MSTAKAIDEFRQAIEAAGLTPPPEITADGHLHRFPSNGNPDDDAGWYVAYLDGIPAGAFGDWRVGINEKWCAKSVQSLTKDERARFQERIITAQQQRADEDQWRHQEAAQRAQAIWDQAQPAPADHPYLVRKKIKAHVSRMTCNGELVICIMVEGKLSSLQFISADGEKRFLSGGAVSGGSCSLGGATNMAFILVCEGFATGAALREATGLSVVIAFSAGNLLSVAQA